MCKIVATAHADADVAAEHLDQLTEHLLEIGCTCKAEVEEYFQAANRTLASLYFVAAKAQPSPDGLKRLAIRYALDARQPVEGDLRRFEFRRLERGWEAVEYQSVAARRLPFQLPGCVVRDIYAVLILDFVFASPPRIFDLMELIENLLGGVPSRTDCSDSVEGAEKTEQEPKIRVDLKKSIVWLNEEPIPVSTEQAYFVDAINSGRGNWVSIKSQASEKHRLIVGSRPDRVRKGLPAPIRSLIESKGGSGFRLLWRE
ncbi:MAG: hypothetical protein H8E44_00940 [Planctomycetes bacterium]|nr:hypothetical protein [Planctomycetota bacterium]